MAGNAGDQSVTGDTVTDTGADRATSHDQSTADEGAGSDSRVHYFIPP
ncbi:hypothetical protein I551_8920 [Mycobacterium ulcerans str. Harvey]|uniref:Uncharacterized protein n=1 Tax=Mycobacterium ulcerans str. Harvey TaxID=1299332 RepID=A0ABP3ATS0_MYCUL|nr:hypothetical protein I551_8920 [Mycobacterium ulcerans str. Harvey]